MSQSRESTYRNAVVFAAMALCLVFAAQAVLAAKVYKLKDLDGDYRYIVSEIRVEPADLEYCTQYGTIQFDGAGFAEILDSVRNCTLHPAGTVDVVVDDPSEFHYEVMANGEVLLIELDDMGMETDYVTHGQILQKGNLLLFDGTAAFPHHPEFLLTTAVAAKE